MNKLTVTLLAAFTLALAMVPTAYGIGPLIEGFMVTNNFGSFRMAIPNEDPNGGISHDLDADDWVRFRVRVTHDDSEQMFFVSDGFAPTNDTIQLCAQQGCEALPIDLGSEELDWQDASKISFNLEAKECILCSWTPFPVAQQ